MNFSRILKLGIVLIALAPLVARAGEPRLATKLGKDSTIFKLAIDSKKPPKVGSSFKVRIHVTPHGDWHVYSSKMSSDGGLTPLTLQLPTDLAEFFEITKIEETGDIHTGFDSNFMAVTMAHYSPYDIIATVKVLKKAPDEVPFYLLLHYQTCNEYMCMPPRTFAVPMTIIGDQPIKLMIAQNIRPGKVASRHKLAAGSQTQ
jgi:hypothetical protein